MNRPPGDVVSVPGACPTAEEQQARYYRALLDRRRAELDAEIADLCAGLAQLQQSGDAPGSRQTRRVLRAKQREQFEIECLRDALNRRFFVGVPTGRAVWPHCFDIEITPEANGGCSTFPTSTR